MDKKSSADRLGNMTCNSINKHSSYMETDDILQLSSVDTDGYALRPVTPKSNKECSDIPSPLTLESSLPTIGFYRNENDVDNPSTPKAAVFDPFAPGPDNLLLAPRSLKCIQESRSYVERMLNFNSLTKNDRDLDDDDDNDDILAEAVYDSLLECIISKQAEDIFYEISTVDSKPNAFVTPPFAPRLTGIADTCPNAPLKPAKKSRYIDLSLCRKLEFDFDL